MAQRQAKHLQIGQLVKLNGVPSVPTRWAEVCRQEKTVDGIVTWVCVVNAPEDEDLIGAETTIEGSENFHGVGWYCVSSLAYLPTFTDVQ